MRIDDIAKHHSLQLQFNNGLYVDPVSGDIFSVESDTGDKMVRFPRDANGNVSPKSILHTPHRVYNIAADEVKQELFVTVALETLSDHRPLQDIERRE